jgi:hypothetical protein
MRSAGWRHESGKKPDFFLCRAIAYMFYVYLCFLDFDYTFKLKQFMEDNRRKEGKELVSKSVKAGKRTYFFDMKETRYGEHYLVIAESKRHFDEEKGHFFYEKHKIFLHVQDLEKFADCLAEMNAYAKANFSEEELHPFYPESEPADAVKDSEADDFDFFDK